MVCWKTYGWHRQVIQVIQKVHSCPLVVFCVTLKYLEIVNTWTIHYNWHESLLPITLGSNNLIIKWMQVRSPFTSVLFLTCWYLAGLFKHIMYSLRRILNNWKTFSHSRVSVSLYQLPVNETSQRRSAVNWYEFQLSPWLETSEHLTKNR